MAQRSLAIIERAYRGAVETQYFDVLFLALEMSRQMDGLDVLLRGPAVNYGVRAEPVPELRIGSQKISTLNDPRVGIGYLLQAGSRIFVDEGDLAATGLTAARLLEGVVPVASSTMARSWPDYRQVLFL